MSPSPAHKINSARIKKWLLTYVVLATFTLLALRNLLAPGFFETHDGIVHVMRLAHFDQAFLSGQFPVRWLPGWMAGYGSPVFNFNWNLPYYAGVLLHQAGLSYVESIKAVIIVSSLLSVLFCFLFLYQMTHNRLGAVVGAILYVWAPYYFSDVFIRGAIGETVSFVFFPLLFWLALLAFGQPRSNQLALLSLPWVLAAFILGHNVMSLVGTAVFILYSLFLLKSQNNLKMRPLSLLVFSLLGGIALSAFFWLPAVAEKKYDQVSHLRAIYNYQDHFVPVSSLLFSPWRYGYSNPSQPDKSMSFQLGIVHWVGITVALVWVYRRRKVPGWDRNTVIFFLGLCFISLLGVTRLVQPLYGISFISGLNNFPWRLLEVATFSSSVVIGLFISSLKRRAKLFSASLLLCSFILYWSYGRIVTEKYSLTDQQALEPVAATNGIYRDTEYLPLWANYFALLEQRGVSAERHFRSDSGTLTNTTTHQLTTSALVTCQAECAVELEQFYFPGWIAAIDGHNIPVYANEFGLVATKLTPGVHELSVSFVDTPVRRIANTVSLISLLGLGGWTLLVRLRYGSIYQI